MDSMDSLWPAQCSATRREYVRVGYLRPSMAEDVATHCAGQRLYTPSHHDKSTHISEVLLVQARLLLFLGYACTKLPPRNTYKYLNKLNCVVLA